MMPLLRQDHFYYLLNKIKDTSFQIKIFDLISSGNSKIRLKGLSITKVIFESFIQISKRAATFLRCIYGLFFKLRIWQNELWSVRFPSWLEQNIFNHVLMSEKKSCVAPVTCDHFRFSYHASDVVLNSSNF